MIVATSVSKYGGKCARCPRHIPRGGPIWKIATSGDTTKQGNGPGDWVCEECAAKDDDASV